MSPPDAAALVQDKSPVIADIRDPSAFAAGHIPGAERLTNENLADFIARHDPQTPVIVVCYHGISSQNAGQYLAQQGFAQVYSLDGGMVGWANAYPEQVEQDA
ncbi:thiosulfate sulfurtransferase GlpE [Aliidiomarina sanyensis]|uniref:Thiosulfate sulfurtransferase GlpE n=1 Tax=Aliidiomarina sanyensis TaxID=1249555 RepID=A0A432WPZ9_9GAMM|nr:thiosulfate sulfurtransferase GlpE [Aliidiomarina sanyensis]RUO35886.1 thiosulfate sulfurtransferase GlpE [Aliidiomarina sanyensis]